MKDPGIWLAEQALPSVIEIQVRLIPVWVDNETAFARLDENAACPLYPPQSVFSKVRVEATGVGQYQRASGEEKIPFIGTRFLDYHLNLPKPDLYQKEFLVQPEGQSVHCVSQGIPSLWAYGAQQVGDDIHPLVFTLEALRDETILRPTSLLSWREHGIFPTREGDVRSEEAVFQDVFEEDQTRTLVESIEAGMSVITLEVGIDETGESLTIPYHSYRLSKNYLFYKKGE